MLKMFLKQKYEKLDHTEALGVYRIKTNCYNKSNICSVFCAFYKEVEFKEIKKLKNNGLKTIE